VLLVVWQGLSQGEIPRETATRASVSSKYRFDVRDSRGSWDRDVLSGVYETGDDETRLINWLWG
jgi:hypothetical protein